MAVPESAPFPVSLFRIPVIKGIHLSALETESPDISIVESVLPSPFVPSPFKVATYLPLTINSLAPEAAPVYSQTMVRKFMSLEIADVCL